MSSPEVSATYIKSVLEAIKGEVASGIEGAAWAFAGGEWAVVDSIGISAIYTLALAQGSKRSASGRPSMEVALKSLRSLDFVASCDRSVLIDFGRAKWADGDALAGTCADGKIAVMTGSFGQVGTFDIAVVLPYSAVTESSEGWKA